MRTRALTTSTGMKGWTDIALFDKDGKRKPLFHPNALWKLAKRHLGLDLQIPLLFGLWSNRSLRFNTITNVGKKIAADQTGGTTTAPVTAIAIGVGTPSATALGSESTTNGGSRGAATVTNQTTTTTGDTERWVKTFTFTGSLALTEEGLLTPRHTIGDAGVQYAWQRYRRHA